MRDIIALVGIVGAIIVGSIVASPVVTIPQCVEDAVIVGAGDYVDGRWSEYVCGPSVDDMGL